MKEVLLSGGDLGGTAVIDEEIRIDAWKVETTISIQYEGKKLLYKRLNETQAVFAGEEAT